MWSPGRPPIRHSELEQLIFYCCGCLAERDSWSEAERDRSGDEAILVIDHERRRACAEVCEGRKRHHCFIKGADGSTRRSSAMPSAGERIVGRVARQIVGE